MGEFGENFSFSAYFNLSKHMKLWEEKRGSPRGELAPARATERGLQFIGLHLNLD